MPTQTRAKDPQDQRRAPRRKASPAPSANASLANAAAPAQLQRLPDHLAAASPADLAQLQARYGNRAVAGLLKRHPVQAKLEVGPANDRYEQEADRMADQVMSPGAVSTAAAATGADEAPDAQRSASAAAAAESGLEAPGGFEQRLDQQQGGGRPLPDQTRELMESRFNADFGQVHVHADAEAGRLARSVQARAFTHGADIYMAEGEYQPGTRDGQHLLAHELTHTLQQGAVRLSRKTAQRAPAIQRKEMTASEITTALEGVPFIKAKLDAQLMLGRGDKRDTESAAMRAQVQAVLAQYETNLKSGDKTTHHAMILATVLEAVARVIAVNELNDPALVPLLSVKLLELYRAEIEASLPQMDEMAESLHLAEALVADDPVGLYMHNELHKDEAARRVRQMAFLAGKDDASMFRLLQQRFEIQMGAQTKTGVAKRADKNEAYSVREASGEVSSEYFTRLFGNVEQAAWKTDKRGIKRLTYTPAAKQRLRDLETVVTGARVAASSGVVERNGLTFKQSKHLQEIEQREAAINQATLDGQVDAGLATMLKVSAPEATKIRQQVKLRLGDLPLTVTVSGMGWFGKRSPRRKYDEAKYKAGSSRRESTSYAELFDKPEAKGQVSHLGEYEDPATSTQKRGENYLRFRNWKDNVMTGGLAMSDKELPVFGAANVNWEAYSSQGTDDPNYGVNAYGDTHFVLRKANVGGRLVYTATDHGAPRRDIYLAFADFVLGGMGITGLKDVGRSNMVKHIVNSIITEAPVAAATQPFEVQIFGELDIARDVEKIVVAPSVPEKAKTNVRKFGNKTGVPVQFLTKPTEAVKSEAWFQPMPWDKGDNLVQQVQTEIALLP